MSDHTDKAECLAGDTAAFTWHVNPQNKGVQNVVVWVKPPDGKFFKPNTPSEKTWKKDDVAINMPHCAFVPHVQVAFVSYFDGKDPQKSGQKIKLVNDAPITHNVKWTGSTLRSPGANPILQPKQEDDITSRVKADTQTPIALACNIHTWMHGYLWAIDTPYYAITDKDGTFEIKDLPAGTEVYVVQWHEGLPAGGWVDGPKGTRMALKAEAVNDLGEIKVKR